MVGRTLGHYEIIEPLGAGGMGEVYRAHDTTLKRDVAIKVLPEDLSADVGRLARLEREAQLLAALNHPNIEVIHGLEESDGVRFMVLELIEGESLAETLSRGRIEVEKALGFARQIAEALEAAHAKGIIHRDLKPGNVVITPEGQAKVLDFGLAKGDGEEGTGQEVSPDLTESPTVAAATRAGIILGTAAYMSPEQARGKPLDKRTDIWSFGCVLYEMLTGSRPFQGETVTDVLAAIVEREPDWSAVPDDAPPIIRLLLRQCLEKDPYRRLHDIADARIEIVNAISEPEQGLPGVVAVATRTPLWQRAIPWGLAVLFLATTVSIWALLRLPPETPTLVARVHLLIPEGEEVGFGGSGTNIAMSPDGSRLVYVGSSERRQQLWLRSLDEHHATPVPGTEGARAPFFSLDGQLIAFQDRRSGSLKVVSMTSSSPVTLVEQTGSAAGDWGPDGMVYFGSPGGGISRVPASGGEVEVLTKLDTSRGDLVHSTVDVLPNGKGALLTIWRGQRNNAAIAVVEFKTGAVRELGNGIHPHYAGSGHLVYVREDGVLLAAPFDQDEMELVGLATELTETAVVYNTHLGAAEFSMASTGTLLRIPEDEYRAQPVWVDRNGSVQVIDPDWVGPFFFPALSPDGTRIAISVDGPDFRHIWIKTLAQGAPVRLTFEGSGNQPPAWTPDGRRVTYASVRGDRLSRHFWEKQADGTGEATLVFEVEDERGMQSPVWSEDKSWLVYQWGWYEDADIYGYQTNAEAPPIPLVATEFREMSPALSPDGRWLAYASNRTGRDEVYVRPFPNVGDSQWQVSTEGGVQPLWAHNGRELFYLRWRDELVAVEYESQPTFRRLTEHPLFWVAEYVYWGVNHSYAVGIDDQRFVMLKRVEGESRELMLTFNWFEELKRLVPTER